MKLGFGFDYFSINFCCNRIKEMVKFTTNFVFFSYKCMIYFQTAWCKFRLWIEVNYFFYPLPSFERIFFIFLKKIFKMWFFAPSSEICYEIFISFMLYSMWSSSFFFESFAWQNFLYRLFSFLMEVAVPLVIQSLLCFLFLGLKYL